MPRKKLKEVDRKSKITININENLLIKIDSLIKDGNRSKLIEELIIYHIKNKEKDE